ncbi:MAG TPA: histidine phosphatase family protein [Iamia sp.]|nr:histidine phosphatase family protein [Iamia sp.]
MTVEIVYETHSLTEDNERGMATGWHHGRLSADGRALAADLGERRLAGGFAAVLVSDLRRAVETAEIAFGGSDVPVLHDWRLRETDFGLLNGRPVAEIRAVGVEDRFPGGESRLEAIARVDGALDDIAARWADRRVLVIAHLSAVWALESRAHGLDPAAAIATPFTWQEGWTYRLD